MPFLNVSKGTCDCQKSKPMRETAISGKFKAQNPCEMYAYVWSLDMFGLCY